jgi:hypothetical protein
MLVLNGQEAEATFGLIVTNFSGDLGAPARSLSLLNIPSLAGALDPGIAPNEAVRVFQVDFMVQATSDATVHAALDKIKAVCGGGLVEIKTLYSTSRALYGVLQPLDASGFRPWIAGWVTGSMSFVVPMPFWIETTHNTVGFGATPTDIPLGSAPSTGRDGWSAMIEIVGAAVTPTLTWKNSSSDTLGTMALTNTVAAGDSQVFDLGRKKVWRVTAGTWTNGMGDLTAGYTWPDMDPSSGSFAESLWPKLSVSAGAANIRYYRMWR